MDIIRLILEVARSLFDIKGKFDDLSKERKKSVAEYYEKISTTLYNVANKLRNEEVPHGDCEKMLTYSELLPATIGDVIGMQPAEDLSQKLRMAHEVEGLLAELGNKEDREDRLADLERAAGYFEALADSLRASG